MGGVRTSPWVQPSLCAGAALYLYLNLFVSSRVPILLGGDQMYFWMEGQRILHGELPYRDFFQFTPPGTDLFYFAVFRLFGAHIWVTNLVVLTLGVALCWLCFSIARQIMELKPALAAAMLFLTLIYTKLLNATHHWFSVLAILCAVRILLPRQSPARMLAAGGLLGMAGFFTQSHAVAALFAFLIWLGWQNARESRSWRRLLADAAFLLLGFAITLGVAESYFIATIGWRQLWYFQVTYVLHFMVHGPETSFLGMPPWSGWGRLPGAAQYLVVYLLLPVVYALALIRVGRENSRSPSPGGHGSESYKKARLVALIGAMLLCEVMFSLNWLRIYAISMPGIILLLWLVGQAGEARRALGVRTAGVAILLIAAVQIARAHHRQYVVADWPAGWAAVNPEAYEKLHWIEGHTRPEEFFFQAAWPGVYLPLRLRNPIFEDGVGLDSETRPEFLQRSMVQLDAKNVRYILWSQQLNPVGDFDPPGSALPPLRAYLHDHYRKVKVFADQDEVWERE